MKEVVFPKPGYEHPDDGTFVSERDALQYAIERIENGADNEKQDFLEWFFSDWYYVD